jgi:L-fuconolactonase
MLIIDSHCHTANDWYEPIETLLYQMDTNRVSHAVLVQFDGQYDSSYPIECTRRYKNKFKAVGILDPEDKSRTKTLERLHKQGVAGIRIDLRKGWDDDDPVFKAAGELGMIMDVIGKAETFASARFKKLLDNFPKTQFCLEHLARSAHPGVDFSDPPHEGFKATLECANWPTTTIKVPGLGEVMKPPPRFPGGYPFRKVPPLFEMAKEAFGVQRMMWGSNFPPCAQKEGYRNSLQWVLKYPAFQTGDDLEWIMGKSAAKLWGFPS